MRQTDKQFMMYKRPYVHCHTGYFRATVSRLSDKHQLRKNCDITERKQSQNSDSDVARWRQNCNRNLDKSEHNGSKSRGKIWPSVDAKPLNRSSPSLKHVIWSRISFGAQSAQGILPLPINAKYTPKTFECLLPFLRLIRHTTRFSARKCLMGWENLTLIIYSFIRKTEKNKMAPMGKF